MTGVCGCLDSWPLAIELAAARVRALSPADIVDGLGDRFQLLTSSVCMAAGPPADSVDFGGLAPCAIERTGTGLAPPIGRVCGLLSLMLRKRSRVVVRWSIIKYSMCSCCLSTSRWWSPTIAAVEHAIGCRRRCVGTCWRKLGESGEIDAVRLRHRNYYVKLVALLDALGDTDYGQCIEQAAFEKTTCARLMWTCESFDTELALTLASSL
ncbi:hypothetical protein [Mycobacterium uberis]|uniref:hypothetical protein n=1 Tax=Mycobacterium uberis TaxID=2162698 RepID=UPI000E2FF96E|nr:hypothetical protein [Mycobacterium uberis]